MNVKWSNLKGLMRRPNRSYKEPWLIVMGLGNPGKDYAETRHNVGFWCVDMLADRHHIAVGDRRRTAVIGEGEINDRQVVLAKPRTFVNLSGQAAMYLLARYKATSSNLLIVYDDINLPLGKIRLRMHGGSGGHNGVTSIIEALNTKAFARLRIGIGSPPPEVAQVDYVLGEMSVEERNLTDTAVEKSTEAVAAILSFGVSETMNRFN